MLNQQQISELKRGRFIMNLKKIEIYDEYMSHDREIHYQKLNPRQHFMFKRVLHGLRLYTKDEIEKMHWDKKRRIIKVWKRSQDVINRWKQKLCFKDVNPHINFRYCSFFRGGVDLFANGNDLFSFF